MELSKEGEGEMISDLDIFGGSQGECGDTETVGFVIVGSPGDESGGSLPVTGDETEGCL